MNEVQFVSNVTQEDLVKASRYAYVQLLRFSYLKSILSKPIYFKLFLVIVSLSIASQCIWFRDNSNSSFYFFILILITIGILFGVSFLFTKKNIATYYKVNELHKITCTYRFSESEIKIEKELAESVVKWEYYSKYCVDGNLLILVQKLNSAYEVINISLLTIDEKNMLVRLLDSKLAKRNITNND